MRSLRRLAKDEFAACFAAPMLNLMATAEPVVDVWGYVEAIALPLGQATNIVIPNAGLEKLGIISKSGALRFGRSTLATPSTHTQPTPSGLSMPVDVCKLRRWIHRATALGYPAVERISALPHAAARNLHKVPETMHWPSLKNAQVSPILRS